MKKVILVLAVVAVALCGFVACNNSSSSASDTLTILGSGT